KKLFHCRLLLGKRTLLSLTWYCNRGAGQLLPGFLGFLHAYLVDQPGIIQIDLTLLVHDGAELTRLRKETTCIGLVDPILRGDFLNLSFIHWMLLLAR
ncbi:hypothetical protein, partial [Pseudomonas aeruginosa]|uniref:hypothetical protein n=1 Tax=Pseudomonas aeruginosa TaxID=287 RepID=UPI001CC1C533